MAKDESVYPIQGAYCFVCGLPLQSMGVAALWGHTDGDGKKALIRFHRGCAPQLAAEALVSLQAPRDERCMFPYFRREKDVLLEERDKEILYCLASGLSNSQIGRQLGVSPKTAKNLVSHILAKLDTGTRTEAAVWAVSHGIVATESMLPGSQYRKSSATGNLGSEKLELSRSCLD